MGVRWAAELLELAGFGIQVPEPRNVYPTRSEFRWVDLDLNYASFRIDVEDFADVDTVGEGLKIVEWCEGHRHLVASD
jgi:hypothetical protein